MFFEEMRERWIETYLPFSLKGLFPYQVKALPVYLSQTWAFPVTTSRLQTPNQHTSRISCYQQEADAGFFYI
jgi:hypothetical protein